MNNRREDVKYFLPEISSLAITLNTRIWYQNWHVYDVSDVHDTYKC